MQAYNINLFISIHAPAKGATAFSLSFISINFDFNPRPREGSDKISPFLAPVNANFNPRPREGSDFVIIPSFELVAHFNPRPREGSDQTVAVTIDAFGISIHAPAKGATFLFTLKKSIMVFQSTPPRRERQRYRLRYQIQILFQSTPPRRERQQIIEVCPECEKISIHAPAKGATAVRYSLMMYQIISIHAPAKGATSSRPPFSRSRSIFQSTPPRRERLL